MKKRNKSLVVLVLLLCSQAFGQMDQYKFKREIKGISETWHQLVLRADVLAKINQDLADIRIYGITKDLDTIEAPYLIQLKTESMTSKSVFFKQINSTHNQKGYYYTFEIPSEKEINYMKLDFGRANFDWKIELEASFNQREWFTVLDDYRLIALKNAHTNFEFTQLNFPKATYRYYRLHVASDKNPNLLGARIEQQETKEGFYDNFSAEAIDVKHDKTLKQTEINVSLPQAVHLSSIKIGVMNDFDYYRPVTINYLSDSVKTKNGWEYIYSRLTTGILNSNDDHEFNFNSTVLQHVQVVIHNQDNQVLDIKSVETKGYVHELTARFSEPATYYLTYGNIHAHAPSYDIQQFQDNIPTVLKKLQLGKEEIQQAQVDSVVEPLVMNKVWLWSIMILIILLLAWFSFKMIKSPTPPN